ncbi:MAG: ribonuclease H-like domain-containing protein [Candidatus Izemoplasmatales bacterium]|nr:ribonuclease H-like domain-containing protein [Candidatus Izemoplasmatales bacterium]
MSNYYLDIETTGLDPKIDSIITIQFQELDRFGNPKGKLIILKSWESSEKEIVNHFIQIYKGNNSSPFNFIAVGFNLNFEHKFLKEKAKQYGFGDFEILDNPSIDLKSIGVLMNNGNFVGSGLDKISGKETDGKQVPEWHKNQEYDKIIEYVTMETKEFIRLYAWLCKEMPNCQKRFREELEDKS